MKGLGDVVQSMVLVLIVLITFVIFLSLVSDESQKQVRLNLREAELLRAKNTASLLGRSLAMTWYLASVQSLFRAGDEAIGCGFADDPYLEAAGIGEPLLEDSYWYQYNPADIKTPESAVQEELADGKYTGFGTRPVICFPSDEDVVAYLQEKFKPFTEIKTPVTANGMSAAISGIANRFLLGGLTVRADTTESISVQSTNVAISTTQNHDTVIYTKFPVFIDIARASIRWLLDVSDAMDPIRGLPYALSLRYQDNLAPSELDIPFDANREAYIERISRVIEGGIEKEASKAGAELQISSSYELLPISDEMQGLKTTPLSNGLALHYDIGVTLLDGTAAQAEVAFDWPTDSRRITSCYGLRNGKIHKGVDIGAVTATVKGDAIYAAEDGRVAVVQEGCTVKDTRDECSLRGNFVELQHDDGIVTRYLHLSSVSVKQGDEVEAGQAIGTMGETGGDDVDGVHLHFAVQSGAEFLNPCDFIACGESVGPKFCEAGSVSGTYYFHDEEENKFIRRPVALLFSAEDYLVAIDCNEQPYSGQSDIEAARKNAVRFFSWSKLQDTVCCGGRIWTCSTDIPEGEWSRGSGERIGDAECSGSLERLFNLRDLECTANGIFEPVLQA